MPELSDLQLNKIFTASIRPKELFEKNTIIKLFRCRKKKTHPEQFGSENVSRTSAYNNRHHIDEIIKLAFERPLLKIANQSKEKEKRPQAPIKQRNFVEHGSRVLNGKHASLDAKRTNNTMDAKLNEMLAQEANPTLPSLNVSLQTAGLHGSSTYNADLLHRRQKRLNYSVPKVRRPQYANSFDKITQQSKKSPEKAAPASLPPQQHPLEPSPAHNDKINNGNPEKSVAAMARRDSRGGANQMKSVPLSANDEEVEDEDEL